MPGDSSFPAQFFDGETAAAQDATVWIEAGGLIIEIGPRREIWAVKDLVIVPHSGDSLRLSCRRHKHALLVLPTAAATALRGAAPGLFDGSRERRRMTTLIAGLMAGAGLVGAALFIGVPAASGPLAEATPKDFEMRMGENLAAQVTTIFRPCQDAGAAITTLQPIINELAETGDVGFPITFNFVRMSAPNAFALPGGQVVATSGLLKLLEDDPDAFVAVLAHELGHVKARDGMKAFYRNAGLGVILEIITGGSGVAQQAVLIGGQLRQLRYNRRQESEADDAAAEILTKSNMDPAALARAFVALQGFSGGALENGGDETKAGTKRDKKLPGWLSSHPDTGSRIDAARAKARAAGSSPISDEDWGVIAKACETKKD